MNNITGKGVYIWQPETIGTPSEVADALEQSGTDVVAIKINDAGYVYPNRGPYIQAIRDKGIKVGGWGYVYLKWNALAEANGTVRAIQEYQPNFYLIDAEAHALYQYAPAVVYGSALRRGIGPDFPVGLNSYWKPTWHPALPWSQLRKVSDFDAPQVYWRNYSPVTKLKQSKLEFSRMSPRLPYKVAAGDMYTDRGIKPTLEQVTEFLTVCRDDPEIQFTLMWSMDQKVRVPELWEAYSRFSWNEEGDPQPEKPKPLYSATVWPWRGLNVRPVPSTTKPRVDALPRYAPVDVWYESMGWAAINLEKSRWVYSYYLRKME